MKKLFFIIIVTLAIISCKSEREIQIEQIQKESVGILSKEIAILLTSGSIDQVEADKIMQTFTKIFRDSAELGYQYALQIKDYKNSQKKLNSSPDQSDFINKKVAQFRELIDAGTIADQIKNQSNTLTKSLLSEYNNHLTNWSGKIISLDLYKDNELDIAISLLDREVVGQKVFSSNGQNKTLECTITIEASQATSKKTGYKGIERSGELYNNIKTLKEGDEITFSANVLGATDNIEKTGLNLSTIIFIQITDIK